FGVLSCLRANHTNCADVEKCLKRVGSATMFNDAAAHDSIHVDASDFYAFACRLHAEPRTTMRAPRRDLCQHPIPLSNLTINGQMQIRIGLSHVQKVFPGPFEANGVSGAPIDFDVLRRDEVCKSVHIPGVRNLFNVTTNDELIPVFCHTSMLRA